MHIFVIKSSLGYKVTISPFLIPSLQTYLIMYPHGVDSLQFAGPVLRLVVWDV